MIKSIQLTATVPWRRMPPTGRWPNPSIERVPLKNRGSQPLFKALRENFFERSALSQNILQRDFQTRETVLEVGFDGNLR